jgi:hypothetical protein
MWSIRGVRKWAEVGWVQNRHNGNGQPLRARPQANYCRLLKAKIFPSFGDTECEDLT